MCSLGMHHERDGRVRKWSHHGYDNDLTLSMTDDDDDDDDDAADDDVPM